MGELKYNITELYARPWEGTLIEEEIQCLRRENKELRDKLKNKQIDLPEKYIINEDATILFWKKKEKTIVKRSDDDEFNARLGFLTAFFQHYSGMSRSKANKFLANLKVERK